MKVHAADESRIRKAGKLIDERVRTYSEKFGIHDKQDLLAMVAFDCFVATLEAADTTTTGMKVLADQVKTLTQLVDRTLP